MKVSAVVAMSKNRVIGVGGKLPWHLPEDLKWFKKVTTGHPIIMGRKTFESIGKVLPNRQNVIISRSSDYQIQGAQVVPSLEAALEFCRGLARGVVNDEVFIIGGMQIYQLALPLVDRIYLTVVHQDFEGDAYFPKFIQEDYSEVFREDHLNAVIPHSFLILERQSQPSFLRLHSK